MVLMALDHARAFLFSAVDPENLARASAPLFLTRWVTHFSAPAFVFLAGTAAALSLGREQTPARLARFLVTRGIWLILLELTVVRLSWTFFAAERSTVWLLVLWALGCSMLVLALFTRVPAAVAALVGGLLIAGHNTLDNVRFSGLLERVWNVLHVPGPEVGTVLGQTIRVGYPLIPWIGVMLVGWSYGAALRSPRWQDRAIRRRETLLMGGALLALFVALRVLNGYGDPSPWTRHADALTTLLSFLRL